MSFIRRTMVYLGLVDDDEYDDYEEHVDEDVPAQPPYKPEPNVRKLSHAERTRPVVKPISTPASSPVRPVGGANLKNAMHIIDPKGFADAEQIGEKYRQNIPVLMNLQYVDSELAKRLIDFASGLTYGLGGNIQRAADKVFLLVPPQMEVSAQDKLRMQEQGLFNQS